MNHKNGFVYIITNTYNSVLYIGVTSNLQKRIWEHKSNIVNGFSSKYKLHKLVYYEQHETIQSAIEKEKYLKGKNRKFKDDLVNNFNPDWTDLYKNFMG